MNHHDSIRSRAASGKSFTAAATMRKAIAKSGGTLDDSLLGDIHDAIADQPPPNQLLQFIIIIKRTFVKRFREFYPTVVIDVCLLLATACVVGGGALSSSVCLKLLLHSSTSETSGCIETA